MSGDRIDWVSGKPREAMTAYRRWSDAIERADHGDKAPLIALFRSEEVLGPDARDLVAQFLDSKLGKRRGRPATPAYRVTPAEGKLRMQAAGVRYWKKKGLSNEKAIRAALRDDKREELDLDPTLTDEMVDEMVTDAEFTRLENLIAGRRGSSRRRRPKTVGLKAIRP